MGFLTGNYKFNIYFYLIGYQYYYPNHTLRQIQIPISTYIFTIKFTQKYKFT